MKVIGLVGGVGWESTAHYYRLINQEIKARLGSQHSAELVLYSLDYEPLIRLQQENRWSEVTKILIDTARKLELAGADFLLVACNVLHVVAEDVQAGINIPLLHIADGTAEEASRAGISVVGLLGSRFVMEQAFFRDRLSAHDIRVVIPSPTERVELNRIIYDELSQGDLVDTSKRRILEMVDGLKAVGAQAVVLGCTELPLLIHPQDTPTRLLDTMAIHVQTAISRALE